MPRRGAPDVPASIMQGDRAKAYRPLPWKARRAALSEALAAIRREDWFLAHELLEPAWMGTEDLPERDFYQGLIKLAAGHVHRVRGNANGLRKHLIGARTHLRAAMEGGARDAGLDLPALDAAIDDRLRLLSRLGDRPVGEVPSIALPRRS